MNDDRIQGNWSEHRGKVKEKWGELTDDDLDRIAGNRDQLLGRIQVRHGRSREEAEAEVTDWHRSNPTAFFERY
jgi:uncharacterized protein YjbJ (UPF0337 family)